MSVATVFGPPSVAPRSDIVLVLVSCKQADEVTEDPPCTASRSSFLDTYLAGLGISHKIVTDTESFRAELRSGRYNAYWVSGGADKLLDNLADEVREAAFRGETVVIDGVHDQRNNALDEVVGIIYHGKPSGLTTVSIDGRTSKPTRART